MSNRRFEVAKKAAVAAGEIIQKYYAIAPSRDKIDQTKATYNLVTQADLEAEAAIREIIQSEFPGESFWGEESGKSQTDSPYLWVIDPLDGTNNFAHRVPHYSVSIGLLANGVREVGIVFDPNLNEMFVAVRGEGATVNGEQVRVSSRASLNESLLAVGFYYDRGRMMEKTLDAIRELFYQNIHGIRRFGSAALDLCYIGCGRFEGFFEYQLEPWDFAAGALFVEEAGGKVTRCNGEKLEMQRSTLLASNGLIHQEMLEIVRRNIP